jgi:hypothetical protein
MVNFSFSTEIAATFLDLDMLVVWSRHVTPPGQKAIEGFRTSAGGMEAQCQLSEDGHILG